MGWGGVELRPWLTSSYLTFVLADGPDEVHLRTIGRLELRQQAEGGEGSIAMLELYELGFYGARAWDGKVFRASRL